MGEIHQYPSDISWEEYNLIREDLEGAKKQPGPENMICMMCFVQCCT
jgi:hypothetical protein